MTELELEAQYFKDSLFALGKDIAVRIEGKSDESFWSYVFKSALPHIKPEFYPQCFQFPSSGAAGKNCVLLLKEFASEELVLCVDSDYDYLLENPLLSHPFIFQTYCYSIENHWCYAEGLAEIVKKSTNTEGGNFDFNKYIEAYSNTIYVYLILSLFSKKQKDDLLSQEDLGKYAGFTKINKPHTDLKNLKASLKIQFDNLNAVYSQNSSFKVFKRRLTTMGLTKENAYQFVRGHDILGKVALPLMKYVGGSLTNKHYKNLKTNQEKAGYQAHIKAHSFDEMIQNNPNMPNSYFYHRIVQDIQKVFTSSVLL